jgi:deoxyribonuclease-4
MEKVIELMNEFQIGFHVKKERTLIKTISMIPDVKKPYQIFLSGPQSSKMFIEEEELKKAKDLSIQKNIKMYIHSQYIINLCNSEIDWHTDLLIKNLEYANKFGCKGVVVHVGKYTKQDPKQAIENMYENIKKVIEYATPECPLLLETPAGQGTETLCTPEEFLDFIMRFENDPRIRVCIDTCHVFTSGFCPLEYMEKINHHLIKLVHFNDSKTKCGQCVDRHELIGEGFIGMEKMKEIAEYGKKYQFDMLYEG